jgi:hypothetical protein
MIWCRNTSQGGPRTRGVPPVEPPKQDADQARALTYRLNDGGRPQFSGPWIETKIRADAIAAGDRRDRSVSGTQDTLTFLALARAIG